MTKARILADYVAGGTTAAEFDYMDGVTSNVQTQLDAKAPLASPTFTGNFTSVGIDDNADATAVTIDSGEKVGIGDTAPPNLLTVKGDNTNNGNGDNYGQFVIQGATNENARLNFGVDTDASPIYGWITAGENTVAYRNLVLQLGGGNVGIGTASPDAKLFVAGRIKAEASLNGDNIMYLENTHSSGYGPFFRAGGGTDGHYTFKVVKYTGTQVLKITGNGNFVGDSSADISDERLKENIATVTDALTKIKALTGRTFTWKEEADMSPGTKYGLIAQELETVIPDLIYDKAGIRNFDKDDNLLTPEQEEAGLSNTDVCAKSIVMTGLIPVLIEAVKELSAKNDALEAENTALKTRMDALEARVTALEPADE